MAKWRWEHLSGAILWVLLFMLCASIVRADEPPPVPPGGLIHDRNEPCVDPVWGLQGTCFYSHDQQNNRYVAFYVGDLAMYISKLIDGQYVEIWRRAADV